MVAATPEQIAMARQMVNSESHITGPGLEKWLSLNAEYAKIWPNIAVRKVPPPDWKEWEGKADKLQYFSPNPGSGD
jgi:ferredoxin